MVLLPPFSEELPDWALGPPDWETGSARLAWVDRTSSVASGKNLAGISGCSTYIILDESQAFDGRPSQAFIRAMQRNLIARGGGGSQRYEQPTAAADITRSPVVFVAILP